MLLLYQIDRISAVIALSAGMRDAVQCDCEQMAGYLASRANERTGRIMKSQLDRKYRPKADRQLLRDLIAEAWEAYSKEQFPEWEQDATGLKLASLLEQRFPQDDMAVLAKYHLASAPENVSINIYHPTRQRWDVYANIKLPRPVLCPQGRAHFFVGGNGRTGDDHLPAEFEPYFNKVLFAREAYNSEARFTPERNGSYPTWAEIADQLAVAGKHIRARLEREDG